jgi:uncharacterized protein (DUF58 family)
LTVRTARLATRRGVVEAAPVEVASTAPFGVAEARRAIESAGRIVIFPRVVPLGRLPLLEETAAEPSRLGPVTQRGDGQEFVGVRDFRYGDSLRSVHWPSTARRGAPVVREMELDRPASLVILLDTWADGGAEQSVLDLCCTVTASVAMKALGAGHDVLLGAAQEGHAGPPARMGRREALTWLAGLAAPGGVPLPVVMEQAPAALGRAAALIVLPTWRPNSASALQRPAARLASGGPVVAVVIDAHGLDPRGPSLGPAEIIDLERTLASAGAEVRRVASVDDLGPDLGRPAGPLRLGTAVGTSG